MAGGPGATRRRRGQRGVSLVEAIVAMAVMAFGMLAIVAVQATLRLNSDVAKQRSEAVRIAQEAIEDWRAFSTIPTTAGVAAFADIATLADMQVAGYTTNTGYTLTRSVAGGLAQGLDSVRVVVSWEDRAAQAQAVTLDSIIAAAEPALSGSLRLAPIGSPTRLPMGRNLGIPVAAVDRHDGTSALRPPGDASGAIVWIFNNQSGVITSVCTSVQTDLTEPGVTDDCIQQPSFLIAGFVRFSYGPSPDALNPTGEQTALSVVARGAGIYASGDCFAEPVQDPKLTHTAYACRVPLGADGRWSGRTMLAPPLDLMLFDVCRYTTGSGGNADHPDLYLLLDRSLGNQNFLVVDEGIACPVDPPAYTVPHQPPN